MATYNGDPLSHRFKTSSTSFQSFVFMVYDIVIPKEIITHPFWVSEPVSPQLNMSYTGELYWGSPTASGTWWAKLLGQKTVPKCYPTFTEMYFPSNFGHEKNYSIINVSTYIMLSRLVQNFLLITKFSVWHAQVFTKVWSRLEILGAINPWIEGFQHSNLW